MSKVPFTKPPLTYEQQLNLLKQRGMTFENEKRALHLLEAISYYRLSGYWYPFLEDPVTHKFKPGATFEAAFSSYCFDRKLKSILLPEIEKIEIGIRAKVIYCFAHANGAFWFSNNTLFNDVLQHANSLVNIEEEYHRSDELFIKSFKKKYLDPLPPAWIMMEISSFGTLSRLYQNIKPGKEKREVAHYFGLSDDVFASWIHSVNYVRNVCAHHSRLWNRHIRISPVKPASPKNHWLSNDAANNRLFYIMSVIIYFLNTVNPKHSFREKVYSLLDEYNGINPEAMGFPANWKEDSLWKL